MLNVTKFGWSLIVAAVLCSACGQNNEEVPPGGGPGASVEGMWISSGSRGFDATGRPYDTTGRFDVNGAMAQFPADTLGASFESNKASFIAVNAGRGAAACAQPQPYTMQNASLVLQALGAACSELNFKVVKFEANLLEISLAADPNTTYVFVRVSADKYNEYVRTFVK